MHIPVEVSLFAGRRESGVSVDVDPNPLIIDYHTNQEQTNIKKSSLIMRINHAEAVLRDPQDFGSRARQGTQDSQAHT